MRLSVIIGTRNRAHAIIPCLDSIARSLAKAAPVEAEIIVVDNGSEDDTSACVAQWAKTCAFPVVLRHEPKKGVSCAKNHAMRVAKGDLLIFTDDDCRMSEDYIGDALRHDAADAEPVLRGGRVELGNPQDLPLTIKTERVPKRWSLKANSARHDWIGNCIVGCNMAIPRKIVERIGFFDERYGPGSGFPSGEDTDYFYRAYLAGIDIEYVPDMAVFHHHGRKSVDEALKLLQGYEIGNGALYAKYLFSHPGLCRPLFWNIKGAVKEALTRTNLFMPSIGFSNGSKTIYQLAGMAKYFLTLAGIGG